MTSSVTNAARGASDHPLVEKGARLGYASSGVVHLLLGWLAVQLAWGSGKDADQSSALEQLAGNPVGAVLLWVVVLGFLLLGIWQIGEAVVARETTDRVKAIAKAAGYLALAVTAFRIASGSGSSDSDKQASSFTETIMDNPLGQLAVGLGGLVVIGVGVYHVVKGWKKKFLEDLASNPPHAVELAGQVGYPAKGLALGVLGILFVLAAVQHDANKAGGIDAALKALLELPLGPVILTIVGLGIAAFGLYCFGRAKHAKV